MPCAYTYTQSREREEKWDRKRKFASVFCSGIALYLHTNNPLLYVYACSWGLLATNLPVMQQNPGEELSIYSLLSCKIIQLFIRRIPMMQWKTHLSSSRRFDCPTRRNQSQSKLDGVFWLSLAIFAPFYRSSPIIRRRLISKEVPRQTRQGCTCLVSC